MEYNEIFKATLEDSQIHIGGNLQYPGWSKCPEKIISLEVRLPYDDYLTLKDYDKFNFFIGASREITNKKLSIRHIYTLGCKKEEVTSYRITLLSVEGDKHKIGDITVRRFPFGKEGLGRTATAGWKEGISK